jgi:DNA polymerase-3 subunit gamma/tau
LVASVIKRPEEVLDVGKDEMDTIKNIVSRTSEDQLTLLMSEILKAEIDVKNASAPRLALEMSLIKASFLSSMRPLKELLKDIESYTKGSPSAINKAIATETKHDKGHAELASPSGETLNPEASLSEESLRQVQGKIQEDDKKKVSPEPEAEEENFWERAIKKMETPLATKLALAQYKLTGEELQIILNGGNSVFADSIRKNLGLLEKIFSEEIGTTVRIKIETVKEKRVTKKDLKERVMGEPIIKEAIELFEGRITDVIPITEDRKQNTEEEIKQNSNTRIQR